MTSAASADACFGKTLKVTKTTIKTETVQINRWIKLASWNFKQNRALSLPLQAFVLKSPQMRWLDKIPTGLLIIAAIFMLLAPFAPAPHLVEKFAMLMDGTLQKPVDIFDVFWHLTPTALLAFKLYRGR